MFKNFLSDWEMIFHEFTKYLVFSFPCIRVNALHVLMHQVQNRLSIQSVDALCWLSRSTERLLNTISYYVNPIHPCESRNTHELMGFYTGGLTLDVNTMHVHAFLLLKLFPIGCILVDFNSPSFSAGVESTC